jgi:peptide/nickel transport system permease protein
MTGYIVRRGLASIAVVFVVTIVVFLLIRLQTGDALTVKLRQRLPEEQVQALRAEMGLDRSWLEQYVDWLGGVVQGDLGHSLFRQQDTVWSRIQGALPVTIELISIAIVTSIVIGLPIGVLSAIRRNSPLDYFTRLFSVTGLAVPTFWLGTMVLVYGGLWFQYAPPLTYTPFWEDPKANLEGLWIPGLLLGYNLSSITMRITRSSVLEVLRQDYVRTAWAKGLHERAVVSRHVLGNALIPVVTIIGNQFVFVIGSTVVVEFLFHLPGIGFVALESISTRDYNLIQGTVLIIGAVIVAANFLVDLSYAWLDPRIRLAA